MPKLKLIGREKEIKILQQVLKSDQAELLVLYGRRRVGKTYLVREYFKEQNCKYIEFTGIQKGKMKRQLEAFFVKIAKEFNSEGIEAIPINWSAALLLLSNEIEKISSKKKIVLFFDEFPWMVTKKSNLLQEFEYIWNTHWSKLENLKIILCGSAASWIIDNVINAKGGLHNRLTSRILLQPFDFLTCYKFLQYIGHRLSLKQAIELYMVTGGIPYYLKNFTKDKSINQNIEYLCFTSNGSLFDEFDRLFESLFAHPEISMKIIRSIAKKKEGIGRDELIKIVNMDSGGRFNKRIMELQTAGFIQSFVPYGKEKKNIFYKVLDEYCLFYLTWIEPATKSGHIIPKGYWHQKYHSPQWYSWAGHSFENLCLKHSEYISNALGLGHISSIVASWKYIPPVKSKEQGAQVDLLFDRDDGVITLCEIKFSDKVFSISKEYARELANKIERFQLQTKTKKQIMLALICAQGFKENIWSTDLVQTVISLEQMFEA